MARRSSEVPPLSRRRQREEQGLPPFPLPFLVSGIPAWLGTIIVVGALLAGIGAVDALGEGRFILAVVLWFAVLGQITAVLGVRRVELHEDHVRFARFFRRRSVRYTDVRSVSCQGELVRLDLLEGGALEFVMSATTAHRSVVVDWLQAQVGHGAT